MRRLLLYLFFLSFFPTWLAAQKIEVERRVPLSDAPELMLQYLETAYPLKRRLKLYKERNEKGVFFEAKFLSEKDRYSVKFTTEGLLVDTERKIPYKAIPSEIRQHIANQLEKEFRRYNIKKVQEVIQGKEVVGYELVVSGQLNGLHGLFEGQFDGKGKQESLRTIEQAPNEFQFF